MKRMTNKHKIIYLAFVLIVLLIYALYVLLVIFMPDDYENNCDVCSGNYEKVEREETPKARVDDTPPEWDGIMGLDITLENPLPDGGAWAFIITIPFRNSPGTDSALQPPGILFTDADMKDEKTARTVYIEAGQNLSFKLDRAEPGQTHWRNGWEIGKKMPIPEALESGAAKYKKTPAPNFFPSPANNSALRVEAFIPEIIKPEPLKQESP